MISSLLLGAYSFTVHSANTEEVNLLKPQDRYAVQLRASGVNGRLAPSFRGYQNVRCRGLTPPLRGTVIAKKREGLLIVFNADEYKRLCGDQTGVNGQPMLWLYEPFNFVGKDRTADTATTTHGDVTSALKSIEEQKKFTGLSAHDPQPGLVPVGQSGGEAAKGIDPDATGEPVDPRLILPPAERHNVRVARSGAPARTTLQFERNDNIICNELQRDMRGTVIARVETATLVAFNREDWKKACGKADGVLGQPMAWIDNSDRTLEVDPDETAPTYGATREAVAAIKDDPVPPPPARPGQARDRDSEAQCEACGQPRSGVPGANDVIAAVTRGDLDRRCIRNDGQPDIATGGFNAILQRARSRGWNQTCVNELKRVACEESPWKDLGVKDRFSRILSLGQRHAQRLGVDVRAMPCVAAAETLSLEPLIKVFHSCYRGIHNNYTAQGMGQMTRTTFRAYFRRGGAGLSPFRSTIAPFNQPPYTENPDLLFDALGTSVELQLEVMAYTLKEKKRGSPDWSMFFRYHGTSRAYANAANRCMSCLKTRIDQDGKPLSNLDPVQCLSYTARSNNGFHGNADNQIYRSFEGTRNECSRLKRNDYTPVCGTH